MKRHGKEERDALLVLTNRIIAAVKQAFDTGRALGPGGPFVKALAPFLDFYSKALEAVANALEQINNLRKAQVLSTGDSSIISALIADSQPVWPPPLVKVWLRRGRREPGLAARRPVEAHRWPCDPARVAVKRVL